MVAKATGFNDHGAGSRALDRKTPVDDDAFVRLQLNHSAGLDDDLVGDPNGVGARQCLRSGPRRLRPSLRFEVRRSDKREVVLLSSF